MRPDGTTNGCGFNLDRRMFDVARCIATVPGAIGAFRLHALRGIGGIGTETPAEDTDVTMALLRDGWDVVYEGRAIAWTEVPATGRQLWKHRGAAFESRMGGGWAGSPCRTCSCSRCCCR